MSESHPEDLGNSLLITGKEENSLDFQEILLSLSVVDQVPDGGLHLHEFEVNTISVNIVYGQNLKTN